MESLPPKGQSPSSPWQPKQEPDDFMPPAKRQRLSPSPASPYAQSPQTPYANSPSFSNITLPNGAFNQRPQNGQAQNTAPPRPGTLTPGATQGLMGPPQRPVDRQSEKPTEKGVEKEDKPLDINEINDLVASSGINIREEEDFLYASYRSDRNNTSFRTESSQTVSSQNSFDLLSRNNFGALGTSHGSLQQEQPSQSQEEELYEKHRKAARAHNEKQQQHLDDPFLWGASVRKRLEKSANENGIRIPIEGLWDRVAERPQSTTGASATGADGSTIESTKAPSLLTRGAPMEPILALLSLSANERIRGLLEDSYGLARARMFGSDGVVPPQYVDIAQKEGAKATVAVPRSLSRTAWDDPDSVVGPTALDGGQNGLPSPPVSNPSPSANPEHAFPTVEFPKTNALTSALFSISKRDLEAEEARSKLRAERRAKKAAQAAQAVTSSGVTPDPGTPAAVESKLPPGMLGERAPETTAATKKEKAKAANKDVSEEVATRNANITASMQLGGRKYDWMSGSKSKSGAATPVKKPAAQDGQDAGRGSGQANTESIPAGSQEKKGQQAEKQGRKFGAWREDGIGGRGVQLRDWIAVLEADGRERRTLAHAFAVLGDEKIDGDNGTPREKGGAS